MPRRVHRTPADTYVTIEPIGGAHSSLVRTHEPRIKIFLTLGREDRSSSLGMGHGGALALACALAFVADVEAKVGARRGGGYSIVNTGQGGDLDTATTVVILCFVGLAVIFCAFGALGARRLTRYRARYDASRALEELDLGTLTPGTKVTLRHNGVDIDGVGTVLGSSEPHGDRVQIEWPPSTPSHFTYRPDGPRGRKMRVERKAWWPRASVVPYTEPPEETIECEAPARDPPRETTPTTHETLIDGKVMAGAWLCEWRDDDARPEIFDRYKKNTAAAKVTSFGAMLALEADGDCEDGRVRLRSTSVNDADQLIHSKLYAASVSVSASTASDRVVAEMSIGHSKPSVFFNGKALTETEREDVQWPASCVLEGGWRGTDGTGGWMRMCRVSRGWLETRWFEPMGFPRRFNAVKKMRAAVHAVRAHGFFVAAAAAASRERAMKTAAAFDDLDFVDEEVSAE